MDWADTRGCMNGNISHHGMLVLLGNQSAEESKKRPTSLVNCANSGCMMTDKNEFLVLVLSSTMRIYSNLLGLMAQAYALKIYDFTSFL
jgi:hypothetical protein